MTIYPSAPAGKLTVPPSKSMAHRLLVCAGLARGESRIHGLAGSEDIRATIDCLQSLGSRVQLEGTDAFIRGTDPAAAAETVLRCRESGSTLRFFLPICLLSGEQVRLEGSEKLFSRPLSVYEEICAAQKLHFAREKGGVTVRGPLRAGTFPVPGGISSQFISGLLFALPLLDRESRIRLLPPVESRSYIEMTLSTLRDFGVKAEWEEENCLFVPGKQRFLPRERIVEGDWSNAAFFLALGLETEGLEENSLQGDRVCRDYFSRLEKEFALLDISDCPDLGPVLFAYAALHHGGCFTGTARLRLKESDRGRVMQQEMAKFGIVSELEKNRMTVMPGAHPPEQDLDGHNDHRIVMALSVLCVRTGGKINGAEAVRKSFPDYFDRLREVGVRMEISNGMDIEQ